jgi:flagellar M-ring protein FliF
VNSPFSTTEETSLELPFWKQQAFFEMLMSAGRWLVVLIVAWLLWRKLVRPLIQRKVEVQQTQVEAQRQRAEEEDAVSVRLTKDEQQQQRKVNQKLSAEVMSQRIREMSDNDPRVVALVIRQWMSNEL